jgi:hypothetical protein
MQHVLDHLSDPLALLAQIRGMAGETRGLPKKLGISDRLECA